MTEKVQAELTKWLRTQGYPLEMSVAQSFQKVGFQVVQSDFYIDSDTGKSREIDVMAHLVREIPMTKGVVKKSEIILQILVGCSIECKLAQKKPWVLFTGKKKYELHPRVASVSSVIGDEFLFTLSEERKRYRMMPLFKSRHLAHGITQGFSTNEDKTYQAIHGAVKAAIAFAASVNDVTKQSEKKFPLSITFPTVVIDGNLFEAYLDEQGEMVVEKVEFGTLWWKGSIANRSNSAIYIITKSALNTFIDQVSFTAKSYVHLIKQDESLLKDMVYIGKEFQKAE